MISEIARSIGQQYADYLAAFEESQGLAQKESLTSDERKRLAVLAGYLQSDRSQRLLSPERKVELEAILKTVASVQSPAEATVSSFSPSGQEKLVYHLIKGSTYAQMLHAFCEACSRDRDSLQPTYPIDGQELPRLFSCKEILEARLNNYNTEHNPDGSPRTDQDRKKLLLVWNDTCTLVAYRGGTTKFKIVPISEHLLRLPRGFDQASLPLSFADIAAEELDRADGTYNVLLSRPQVLDNAGWLHAAEEDTTLLGTYFDLVSRLIGKDRIMGFYLRDDPSQDQGRALFVDSLDGGSYAYGGLLGSSGSSPRVAQSVAPAGRAP